MTQATHRTCHVCRRHLPPHSLRPWISVRPGVSALIARDHADWGDGKFICSDDLAGYRRRYVENMLEDERGEISALDRQVLSSLQNNEIVSVDPAGLIDEHMTIGDRAADKVAQFGGSWTFILSFAVVLVIWMMLNVTGLLFAAFDPYPFILLNLVLSCIAAIQAPVIMMSQRRQETKDRLRAENDYKVNLKAELEIRQLHEKIDHQLAHQWERLAEMQQLQIELLEERLGPRN
ncbi:putative membrane protein [Hoeflea marina]|uniref:Putative membrane protein n=1 Tax=Hoeflea marina TaxID=274592 RepID=A0A317PPQ2_9HYPH|nr:DUF1003 domain-containing protein [Hoeflea marina]PWW03488.1 putative membrane protein [Hoeflea marina]